MARVLTVIVAVASLLVIWQSGVIKSVLPNSVDQASPTNDPTANIALAGDAMSKLSSVQMTLNGNMVLEGYAGIIVTGTGDLVYPHKEDLNLQYKLPTANGDLVYAVNERIEGGHDYVQIPSKSQKWQDVTNSNSQVAPGMDPISNLEFVHAFRAADDLGDITMDNIDVHHFSLEVDPAKYVQQLKADPNTALSAADEAELTNAGIQVEVWISSSDHLVHQMRVQLDTTSFNWDITYHFSNFQTSSSTNSA